MCEVAVIYFLYYFASVQNSSSALGGDKYVCFFWTLQLTNTYMLLLASCWGQAFLPLAVCVTGRS